MQKKRLSDSGVCIEITGFTLSEYFAGAKRMEIKTEKAQIRPKIVGFFKTPLMKEAHMVKPQIIFFSNDKEISRIDASCGKMNMSNKRIFLKGDVKLKAADGRSLLTESLAIEPKNGFIATNGKFQIKRNGEIIKGRRLRTDIGLN
jgi:LPS export ABC transporter protein LptC